MRGNFKALGLALVAAFAMSAVMVSAAQATPNTTFTALQENAVIYGNQEGPENFLETTPGRKTECNVAEYEAKVPKSTANVTVTPHYAECNAGGVATTVDMNGCHFKFHAGTSVSGTEVTGGKADIICEGTNEITVTVGPGICTIHIPPQLDLTNTTAGVSGITYTNEGSLGTSFVTVDVNINNITYVETDTPSSFFCPFTTHTTHGTNGKFVSKVLMRAYVYNGDETTGAGSTTPGKVDYKRGGEVGGHVK